MPTIVSGSTHIGSPATESNPLFVSSTISGGTVYTVPPNTVTKSLTGNQSSETVVAPSSGKKLQIIGVIMTSNASTFTATLEFETSNIIIQQHFEQGTLGAYIPCNLTGAVDEVLSFTVDNSTDKEWFLIINYSEVDA